MREKGSSPIGVGVLTVLTVLLVLILAVFSASASLSQLMPTCRNSKPSMV